MSNAFSGGLSFLIGDGGDPTETFTKVGEVFNVSGIGKTNGQTEVSNFDSVNFKEYIANKLADGAEVTVDVNLVLSQTQQEAMLTKVDNSENGNCRFEVSNGTNTLTFNFNAVFLGYTFNTSIEDRHTISFQLKISGNLSRATA